MNEAVKTANSGDLELEFPNQNLFWDLLWLPSTLPIGFAQDKLLAQKDLNLKSDLAGASRIFSPLHFVAFGTGLSPN